MMNLIPGHIKILLYLSMIKRKLFVQPRVYQKVGRTISQSIILQYRIETYMLEIIT
jgi:hypothetical protein